MLKFTLIFGNLLQKGAMGIYKLSSFLTGILRQNEIIEDDKTELCTYGIQITLANLINFVIAFSIGFITNSLVEMSIFYVVFVSLRYFCGGYHAKSYGQCFSLFGITCLSYLLIRNGILKYTENAMWLWIMAAALLGICVFLKAPIEHINRPFTEEERKLFRKRSIQVYIIWLMAGTILWMAQMEHLAVCFIGVFFIVSIFMIIERRNEHEEEST